MDSFYLGHRDPVCMQFHQNLGRSRVGHWVISTDLTWNDPITDLFMLEL